GSARYRHRTEGFGHRSFVREHLKYSMQVRKRTQLHDFHAVSLEGPALPAENLTHAACRLRQPQSRRNNMKKITIQKTSKLAAAAMLLATIFAAGAKADCGFQGNPFAPRTSISWPKGLVQPGRAATDGTFSAPQEQATPAAEPSI